MGDSCIFRAPPLCQVGLRESPRGGDDVTGFRSSWADSGPCSDIRLGCTSGGQMRAGGGWLAISNLVWLPGDSGCPDSRG